MFTFSYSILFRLDIIKLIWHLARVAEEEVEVRGTLSRTSLTFQNLGWERRGCCQVRQDWWRLTHSLSHRLLLQKRRRLLTLRRGGRTTRFSQFNLVLSYSEIVSSSEGGVAAPDGAKPGLLPWWKHIWWRNDQLYEWHWVRHLRRDTEHPPAQVRNMHSVLTNVTLFFTLGSSKKDKKDLVNCFDFSKGSEDAWKLPIAQRKEEILEKVNAFANSVFKCQLFHVYLYLGWWESSGGVEWAYWLWKKHSGDWFTFCNYTNLLKLRMYLLYCSVKKSPV